MPDALRTYLHDHLAAAGFALEIIEAWEKNAEHPPAFRHFAAQLGREIASDREVLRQIVASVGDDSASIKHAAGWLADKLTRYKLSSGGNLALARFEGLEVIALGILGKLALWDTLRRIPSLRDQTQQFDLEGLAHAAKDQHARVEARRLEAAQDALKNNA